MECQSSGILWQWPYNWLHILSVDGSYWSLRKKIYHIFKKHWGQIATLVQFSLYFFLFYFNTAANNTRQQYLRTNAEDTVSGADVTIRRWGNVTSSHQPAGRARRGRNCRKHSDGRALERKSNSPLTHAVCRVPPHPRAYFGAMSKLMDASSGHVFDGWLVIGAEGHTSYVTRAL